MARARKQTVDKLLLGITIALVVFGLLVFLSASFSVLAENSGQFYRTLLNQLVLGLVGGVIALVVALKIPYTFWKKYAPFVFVAALIATALVFVPGLGAEYGGARRWLSIGPFSFQPAELLKLGYIVYLAAWLSWVKDKVKEPRWGLVPFLVMTGLAAGILLLQPDTGTVLVMIVSGGSLFFIAGARWRDLLIMLLLGVIALGSLVAVRPYLLDRIQTFADPSSDPLGSSYQIQQSLIAIGSGKVFGRGFGQSVQKFDYLPEPTGDSVFAVLGEEWGFVGSLIIIILFLAFLMRGLRTAKAAPNTFARLLVTGIVILIVFQSFLNIASVIGVFPLTGLPLIFVSQGGSALLFALFSVGIILNISRHRKTT
jgi:cell division protein FtsW